MVSTYEKGRQGEDAAARFLQEQGYEILKRNFRCPVGEIDIVAHHQGYCCFIEVKMRLDFDAVPQEAVNRRKMRRMARAAYVFLKAEGRDPFDTDCRFDVLAVQLDLDDGFRFALMPDAFGLDEI